MIHVMCLLFTRRINEMETRFICDSFSIICKEFFHGGASIFAALCNFNIVLAVICIKVPITVDHRE